MTDAQDLADRYVAVWNETDEKVRRSAIARLWTPEGNHFVNTLEARGFEALEARITGAHERNVRDNGNLFRVRQDARRLSDIVTFHWDMVPAQGGDSLAVGLQVLMTAEDGRIVTDYQFIK